MRVNDLQAYQESRGMLLAKSGTINHADGKGGMPVLSSSNTIELEASATHGLREISIVEVCAPRQYRQNGLYLE